MGTRTEEKRCDSTVSLFNFVIEEERIRRREARLRGEEPSGSPEVDKEKLVNDVISYEVHL